MLLLDSSRTKRDLRADVMRKLGIDVDCAADVLDGALLVASGLVQSCARRTQPGEIDSREKFCADLRSAVPPQRIAFFVGGPEYLAAAPHSDEAPAEPDADALHKELVAALLAQASPGASQRWGILEACRKISSVRAISEARTRAIRETPRPSRWAEAIEQYSAPEPTSRQPLLATQTATEETAAQETFSTETATEATEREELL